MKWKIQKDIKERKEPFRKNNVLCSLFNIDFLKEKIEGAPLQFPDAGNPCPQKAVQYGCYFSFQ